MVWYVLRIRLPAKEERVENAATCRPEEVKSTEVAAIIVVKVAKAFVFIIIADRFPIENQKMKSKFQGSLNFIGVPNKRDLVVDLFFSLCLAMEAIELKSMENGRSQRTCNDVNVSFARKICKLKL